MTGRFTTWHRAHSLLQNVAAISGDFHTHRRYWEFYEMFGEQIHGFTGNYELCIEMAKALSDWENANGGPQAYEEHDLVWIEVVERYIGAMLDRSLETGEIPNAAHLLRAMLEREAPS